jgi:signal-transduction protein with cAMP-binding, CBS, and nucleotidyltransferase domain
MTITVRDMMSKTLEIIQETASVQEAATMMKEKGVNSLVAVFLSSYYYQGQSSVSEAHHIQIQLKLFENSNLTIMI